MDTFKKYMDWIKKLNIKQLKVKNNREDLYVENYASEDVDDYYFSMSAD